MFLITEKSGDGKLDQGIGIIRIVYVSLKNDINVNAWRSNCKTRTVSPVTRESCEWTSYWRETIVNQRWESV